MNTFRTARPLCRGCNRALGTCYCQRARPFATEPLFVMLVHPKEARKRIGTARIVRRCISNSLLIEGTGAELDRSPALTALLGDASLQPVVLYPGRQALDLSTVARAALDERLDPGRRLAILVIDGTWPMAKKMIRTSRKLRALPQVAFRPGARSNYRIRQQPHEICLSTVEAVHTLIDLLEPLGRAPSASARAHDNLLEVFDWMVELQLRCESAKRNAASAPLDASAYSVEGPAQDALDLA